MKATRREISPPPRSGSGMADTAPIPPSDSIKERSLVSAPDSGLESEFAKRTRGVSVRLSILFTASAFPRRIGSTTRSILSSPRWRTLRLETVSGEHSLATITILRIAPGFLPHSSKRDVAMFAKAGVSPVALMPMVNSLGGFGFRRWSLSTPLSSASIRLQPLLGCLTNR